MIDYIKIGILTACVLGSFAIGWGLRNRDFNDYKREIERTAAQSKFDLSCSLQRCWVYL